MRCPGNKTRDLLKHGKNSKGRTPNIVSRKRETRIRHFETIGNMNFKGMISYTWKELFFLKNRLTKRRRKFKDVLLLWDHSFSKFPKFSEKLTFLTPLIRKRTFGHQRVRNVSFSENFFESTNWMLPFDYP